MDRSAVRCLSKPIRGAHLNAHGLAKRGRFGTFAHGLRTALGCRRGLRGFVGSHVAELLDVLLMLACTVGPRDSNKQPARPVA
jgi:hypothetical protein